MRSRGCHKALCECAESLQRELAPHCSSVIYALLPTRRELPTQEASMNSRVRSVLPTVHLGTRLPSAFDRPMPIPPRQPTRGACLHTALPLRRAHTPPRNCRMNTSQQHVGQGPTLRFRIPLCPRPKRRGLRGGRGDSALGASMHVIRDSLSGRTLRHGVSQTTVRVPSRNPSSCTHELRPTEMAMRRGSEAGCARHGVPSCFVAAWTCPRVFVSVAPGRQPDTPRQDTA